MARVQLWAWTNEPYQRRITVQAHDGTHPVAVLYFESLMVGKWNDAEAVQLAQAVILDGAPLEVLLDRLLEIPERAEDGFDYWVRRDCGDEVRALLEEVIEARRIRLT